MCHLSRPFRSGCFGAIIRPAGPRRHSEPEGADRWARSERPTGGRFPGVPGFQHTDLLPLGPDETEYRRLALPPGTVVEAAGRTFLEIDPATITALVHEAVRDIQHLLRPAHLAQLRAIVDDPEASPNDRFVAVDLL